MKQRDIGWWEIAVMVVGVVGMCVILYGCASAPVAKRPSMASDVRKRCTIQCDQLYAPRDWRKDWPSCVDHCLAEETHPVTPTPVPSVLKVTAAPSVCASDCEVTLTIRYSGVMEPEDVEIRACGRAESLPFTQPLQLKYQCSYHGPQALLVRLNFPDGSHMNEVAIINVRGGV